MIKLMAGMSRRNDRHFKLLFTRYILYMLITYCLCTCRCGHRQILPSACDFFMVVNQSRRIMQNAVVIQY